MIVIGIVKVETGVTPRASRPFRFSRAAHAEYRAITSPTAALGP
jgi:hypothetical protein